MKPSSWCSTRKTVTCSIFASLLVANVNGQGTGTSVLALLESVRAQRRAIRQVSTESVCSYFDDHGARPVDDMYIGAEWQKLELGWKETVSHTHGRRGRRDEAYLDATVHLLSLSEAGTKFVIIWPGKRIFTETTWPAPVSPRALAATPYSLASGFSPCTADRIIDEYEGVPLDLEIMLSRDNLETRGLGDDLVAINTLDGKHCTIVRNTAGGPKVIQRQWFNNDELPTLGVFWTDGEHANESVLHYGGSWVVWRTKYSTDGQPSHTYEQYTLVACGAEIRMNECDMLTIPGMSRLDSETDRLTQVVPGGLDLMRSQAAQLQAAMPQAKTCMPWAAVIATVIAVSGVVYAYCNRRQLAPQRGKPIQGE